MKKFLISFLFMNILSNLSYGVPSLDMEILSENISFKNVTFHIKTSGINPNGDKIHSTDSVSFEEIQRNSRISHTLPLLNPHMISVMQLEITLNALLYGHYISTAYTVRGDCNRMFVALDFNKMQISAWPRNPTTSYSSSFLPRQPER